MKKGIELSRKKFVILMLFYLIDIKNDISDAIKNI